MRPLLLSLALALGGCCQKELYIIEGRAQVHREMLERLDLRDANTREMEKNQ